MKFTIMCRWGLTAFFLSFFISMVLLIFRPWGFTITHWFGWPILTALFVFSFIWLKTESITLFLLSRRYYFFSATINALLIGGFFHGLLSLPYLIVISLIMLILINLYFKRYDEYKEAYANNSWPAHIVYFYVLITFYNDRIILTDFWSYKTLDIIFLTPLSYFSSAAGIIFSSILLYLFFFIVGFFLWVFVTGKEFKEFKISLKKQLSLLGKFLYNVFACIIGLAGFIIIITPGVYRHLKTWLVPSGQLTD